MLIDHIGAVFFPEVEALRIVGRLAMPLFAFAVARGFFYTGNRKRYLLQLTILAVVSQVPFMLLFDFGVLLNMVFPWALAVLALMLPWWGATLIVAASLVVQMDYTGTIVLLPVAIYHLFFVKKNILITALSSAVILILVSLATQPLQFWSLLAIPTVFLLNSLDGRIKINKWFFYWFYPVHMLALFGLAQILI